MMRHNAILVNIAERCNIRCRHCGYADSKRGSTMEQADLVDWVTQAVDYGIPQIIFTGGEPFAVFDLLEAGVRAVSSAGGHSGVFTNSLWASTREEARLTLEKLPDLSHLYLSCDKYHLDFVPADNIYNVIEEAQNLPVKLITICITYTTGEDKQEVADLFARFKDQVRFHYARVIPNDYVVNLVPDACDTTHNLNPANFATECFLHTPLINPTGSLATCHVGKVETHMTLESSPYYLGNLKEHKLATLFDRAEGNCVYQYLRAYGPRAVAEAARDANVCLPAGDSEFTSDCDMCVRLLTKREVVDEITKRASEQTSQDRVYLQRLLRLGDPE